MPLFTTLDRWQDDIARLAENQTFGPRPRNPGVKKFDNLPLGKETFRFRRIGKLKRAQEKTLRFEWDDHSPYNNKGLPAAHTVLFCGPLFASYLAMPLRIACVNCRAKSCGRFASTPARNSTAFNRECFASTGANTPETMSPSL